MVFTAKDLNKVIAIHFYGRSGSVFLQSLLDGHPDILMIPAYMSTFYDFLRSCNCNNVQTYGELIAKFVNEYEMIFDAKSSKAMNAGRNHNFHRMGENRDRCLGISMGKFLRALDEIMKGESNISSRLFFQAIHLAYAYALGRSFDDIDKPPIIVFQAHTPSPQYALNIVRDFPDTLFIHIVRNPVNTFGSHVKHYLQRGVNDPNTFLGFLLPHLFYGGMPLIAEYQDRSFAIKLEDVHTRPRETLGKLCEVIGIEWNDCLMQSTFDGLKWWNVKGSEQVSGFNKKIISKKHEDLFSLFDRFRLSVLLASKYRNWKYTPYEEWDDYPLMRELLKYPFKFEKIWFSDEKEFLRYRPAVQQFFIKYWDELQAYKGPDRELRLIDPDE